VNQASASRIGTDDAVPLRRSAAPAEKTRDSSVSEDPVPVRDSSERVEADERAARLRVVTGRRSGWR
jgi:hypothetical protein